LYLGFRNTKTTQQKMKRILPKQFTLFFLGALTLVLILLVCSHPLSAQNESLSSQNYEIAPFLLPDGPSGNSINCIVQGPKGFLWFGGHTGLYRYDGYDFKAYKNNPSDSTSIPFAYIEWLFWSSDDYLWIGTYGGGLIRFNPNDESFVRFQHNPADSTSLSNDRVTSILEESQEILWVGTTMGLNRLDRKTGKFERFYKVENDPTSLSYDDIRVLHIDRQGTLWVGTGFIFSRNGLGGLNQFHPKTKTFTQYLHNPKDANTLAGNVIKAIYEDSKGNFWVGGSGGLHLMNRKAGTFKRMQDDTTIEDDIFAPGFVTKDTSSVVHALLEDFNQRLWIFSIHSTALVGSIAKVDLNKNKMEIVQERAPEVAWQVEQCEDGSIWLAGAGISWQVNKIQPSHSQFKYHSFIDQNHGSPHHVAFEGLVNYKDELVAGKSTNPLTEKPMMHRLNFEELWGVRDFPNFQSMASSSQITSITRGNGLVTNDNDIWGCTGNYASGLFRQNPRTPNIHQFLHQPNNPNSPPTNLIYKIIKDRQGYFWTANHLSVSKINPTTETFTNFLPDANDPNAVCPSVKLDIFEDKTGYIWVGGIHPESAVSTLERINPQTGKVEQAVMHPALIDSPITAIDQDHKGDIYFILLKRGIYVLKKEDIESGEWLQTFMAQPVNPTELKSTNNLIADQEGMLWLTNTNGQIARFNTENDTFVEFDDKKNIVFLDRGVFRLEDGTIYFSTLNEGLVAVHPLLKEDMPVVSEATKVHFTAFHLNGENVPFNKSEVLNQPIWKTNEINLSHQENTLGFRFSSFDLKMPENNQYEVRLLPVEKDWRRINGKPIVDYYGLAPGDYTLEVKGSNSNGVWAKEVAKMTINIAPPWWKTWWAYGLYGLTLFFILFYVRKSELQKQELKLQFEKAQRAKEKAINEKLRKINTATQKFVPNEFLRSLSKENIMDVVLGDYAEQKVTVFFSDIRDYTTLSEQMTPAENFKFVSSFNSRMSPAIHQHKGFINQYLGDAIMAIFPKQPTNALEAAIEMQILLRQYNQARQSKGKSLLRVGIGLHTGSLVMGIIGDEQRMDAATISDTVNVAARIESLTKHFGVNILLSEDTFNQLEQANSFNHRFLGKVLVKGKQRAIGIYECFDGDSAEQQQFKKQTLATFQQGLQAYFNKKFQVALNNFEAVLQTNPQDKSARLFLEKAAYFVANKVEKDWSGVERMEWK